MLGSSPLLQLPRLHDEYLTTLRIIHWAWDKGLSKTRHSETEEIGRNSTFEIEAFVICVKEVTRNSRA